MPEQMYTRTVAFNIETEAIESRRGEVKVEVKYGNTKDPDKRREKEMETVAKAGSRMALDPFFGSIACASFCVIKDGQVKAVTVFSEDIGEEDVIKYFIRQVTNQPTRIVTFNGSNFDLPFMAVRAAILGVEIPKNARYPMGLYQTNELDAAHCDLHQVLQRLHPDGMMDSGRTLSFYAKEMLDTAWPFADVDQSRIGDLIRDGKRATVSGLCEWNVKSTLAIYEKLKAVY